jgi:hypothetical protein
VQEFYYLFVVFLALIISQNTLKVSIHAALRFVQQPLIIYDKMKISIYGIHIHNSTFPLEKSNMNLEK